MVSIHIEKAEDLLMKRAPDEVKKGSLNNHSFEVLDGEGITKSVYDFLTKANEIEVQKEFAATALLEVVTDIDTEIAQLTRALQEQPASLTESTKSVKESPKTEIIPSKTETTRASAEEQLAQSRSSLFEQRNALAQLLRLNQSDKAPFFMVPSKKQIVTEQENKKSDTERVQEKEKPTDLMTIKAHKETFKEQEISGTERGKEGENSRREKEREGKEGGQQGQKDQDESEKDKKRKKQPHFAISATKDISANKEEQKSITPTRATDDELKGDIFTRFMALMARILGQAQADAHALYQRIKERTDNIDVLTGLLAKLNTTKGKVDWSKDPQMKALIDQARAIGVEIPEGKYSWSEEEKRYLKENIQTRKDTLEKVTQLERTDMQRYMQEASQCHQARSNVLKLIKEIMDTIIHNIHR